MSSEQQASAQVQVLIEGNEVGDAVLAQLTSVVVDNDVRLPDVCELRFEDATLDVLDRARIDVGRSIVLKVLSESEPAGAKIFDGEITALEVEVINEQIVAVVRGFDPTHRLQHGSVTETYLNVRASDVVSRIAKRNNLKVGRVDATVTQLEALVQWNQSDWDFLHQLAMEAGRELNFVDGKIEFSKPQRASGPGSGSPDSASATELVAGRNLLRLTASVNSAAQVGTVEVRSWNERNKKPVLGTAKVGKSLGARSSADPAALAGLFGSTPLVAISPGAIDDSTANEHAAAIADQVGSLAAELDGSTPGNPALRAGRSVKLSGVGKRFDGDYRLTSTRHTVDTMEGYVSSFRVTGANRRDLFGLVSNTASGGRGSGITTAIVSNIEDPEKLGRVKVTYSWLHDRAESDWSRVLVPGGGPDRGFVLLPEVGDEVAVAFSHGDPRHALILGGLFSSEDKLPERVTSQSDVPVRLWRSRTGHRIELDDKDNSILVSSGGDKVSLTMSEKDAVVTIDSSGQVIITAKKDVTVKAGGSLSFEATGSMELKGNGITVDAGGGAFEAKGLTAKVAGSTTVELSGGVTAKVAAPMVQIN